MAHKKIQGNLRGGVLGGQGIGTVIYKGGNVAPNLVWLQGHGITGVDENSSSLYVYHQRFGFADFRRLGSGVQRLIQIALAISHSENGVVLIDDIEIGIHWDIFREVFPWLVQWAKKYNVQVFATTHNIYVVDALIDATDLDSDLVLYRLEPRESETRIIRHDRDALKRLREMGQSVL